MADLVTLSAGSQSLILNPSIGGRAVSWKVDGIELLAAKSAHPVEFGMYPMGPWAGRLAGNRLLFENTHHIFPATFESWAIHGTTLFTQWQVVDQSPNSCTLRCGLGNSWPWSGEIAVDWHLFDEELVTAITLTSEFDQFPALTGMHPWFETLNAFGKAYWSIDKHRLAERDSTFELSGRLLETHAPNGTFDDAFFAPDGRATIRWSENLALEIQQSHKWFVVYDQESAFTCVEPQTGPPNGVNDSIIGPTFVVSPDHPLEQVISWKIIRD